MERRSPGESVVQIFTVAAASVLVAITLTAAERVIGLRRLQLLPLHDDSMKMQNSGCLETTVKRSAFTLLRFQTPVKQLKKLLKASQNA